jgi:hypothetical protein
MKKDEYELAYREARAVLYRRGKVLDRPVLDGDGRRRCCVDGLPLTDEELFTEAWDERLATELLGERREPLAFQKRCG